MRISQLDVVISGAVERSGRVRLEPDATIATALRAAGGLAYRRGARPTGELVLRRRSPTSRSVSVHRWNVLEGDAVAWRSFRLEHRDVLVFDWSVGAER